MGKAPLFLVAAKKKGHQRAFSSTPARKGDES